VVVGNGRLTPEGVIGAIAKVKIEIYDQHPTSATGTQQFLDSYGNVAKEAETPSMNSGWHDAPASWFSTKPLVLTD
jgi:hypothetical protein